MITLCKQHVLPANHVAYIVHRFLNKSYPSTGTSSHVKKPLKPAQKNPANWRGYSTGSRTLAQQHIANMANRLGRVQTLGADTDAVHDATATEHAERIIQLCQTLRCCSIATIDQKAIRLNQRRWDPGTFSGFHQKDGQLVEQHAHRMHSYRPSSFSRSSGDCRRSFAGAGVLLIRYG
jgi:hypothetical protein